MRTAHPYKGRAFSVRFFRSLFSFAFFVRFFRPLRSLFFCIFRPLFLAFFAHIHLYIRGDG